MIDGVITQHGGDPRRIFTSRLLPAAPSLADAPGVFAEAGIIAGLPFGAAGSASDAMRAKRDPKPAGSPARGDEMRAAAPAPAWRLPGSIWHSAADRTVAAANAEALEVGVHRLDPRRVVIQPFGAQSCCLWHDGSGRMRLRRWRTAGLGHGKPISLPAIDPYRRLGEVWRFMLELKTAWTWFIGLRLGPPGHSADWPGPAGAACLAGGGLAGPTTSYIGTQRTAFSRPSACLRS